MIPFLLALFLVCYFGACGYALLVTFGPRGNLLRSALLGPAAGQALFVLVCFWLNRLGLPVKYFAWSLAVLFAGAAFFMLRRSPYPWRAVQPFAALLIGAMLMLGWPMFEFGWSWLSYCNDDMANYVLSAHRFVDHGYFYNPPPSELWQNRDLSAYYFFHFIDYGARSGAEMLLAALIAVTGRSGHEVFMPAILFLHASLIAAAAGLVLRTRSARVPALLVCGLLAFSALNSLGPVLQFIAQVQGLAMICLCAALLFGGLRGWRQLLLGGLMLGAFVMIYPEVLPFFLMAWGLGILWRFWRRSATVRQLAAQTAAVIVIALAALNTWLPSAFKYLVYQSVQGSTLGRTGTESTLFPYFLLPSGLAQFWGFFPIHTLAPEPWLSIAIATGGLLLLWAAWIIARQAIRGEPSALVAFSLMTAVAVLLITRSEYGIFKIAMFVQPFLAGVIAIHVRRAAPVAALALAGIPGQLYYVELSRGAGTGTVEVHRASVDNLIGQLRRVSGEVRAQTVISDSQNVILMKIAGVYLRGRRLLQPGFDFFANRAKAPVYRPRSFALMRDSQSNAFFEDTRARDIRAAEVLVSASAHTMLNRRTSIRQLAQVPAGNLRNHLIFVHSERGTVYFGSLNRNPSMFPLEPDPMHPGRTLSAVTRYFLFRVLNPSNKVRFVVDLSTMVHSGEARRLPPAVAIGARRIPIAFTGYGSGRVVSPPVEPQWIDGTPYLGLDMGRDGVRAKERRTGLMRLYGLHVPRDYRQTVALVREVSLISDEGYRALSPPSGVAQFPRGLADPQLEYSGIYEDGWVDRDAFLKLTQKDDAGTLRIRGMVPEFVGEAGIRVLLDGEVLCAETVRGDFELKLTSPSQRGSHRIGLEFTRHAQIPGEDRTVSALLRSVEFTGAEAAPADIMSQGRRVRLGENWYPLETHAGLRFRWVNRDAMLLLDDPHALARGVTIDVEPGPGLAGKPLHLQVFDDEDRLVHSALVPGRAPVTFSVTRPSDTLRLTAAGGGARIPSDPRILNFRVFSVRIADSGVPDIAQGPLVLEGGWYPKETFGGATFRWVRNDALFSVKPVASGIVADIEPGPGMRGRPMRLQLLDSAGRALYSAEMHGRSQVNVALPPDRPSTETYRFHVSGGGHRIPSDPRILNFRVFQIRAH